MKPEFERVVEIIFKKFAKNETKSMNLESCRKFFQVICENLKTKSREEIAEAFNLKPSDDQYVDLYG